MVLLTVTALLATIVAAADALGTPGHAAPVLLHRLLLPGREDAPFVPRASVDVALRQITPVPRVRDELAKFFTDALEHRDALYQVALRRPGVGHGSRDSPDALDISSVKACHLPVVSGEWIRVHIGPSGVPFHADYYLTDVPSSGVCPTEKQLAAVDLAKAAIITHTNTTVTVQHVSHPLQPDLRVPPPLSPQGEPVLPVPEKTFIQKYWLYIMAGFLFLLLSGAPQEEDGSPQTSNNRRRS